MVGRAGREAGETEAVVGGIGTGGDGLAVGRGCAIIDAGIGGIIGVPGDGGGGSGDVRGANATDSEAVIALGGGRENLVAGGGRIAGAIRTPDAEMVGCGGR